MSKINNILDAAYKSNTTPTFTLKKKYGAHLVEVSVGDQRATCKTNDLIAHLKSKTQDKSLNKTERKKYLEQIKTLMVQSSQSNGRIHALRSRIGNALFHRDEKLDFIKGRLELEDFADQSFENEINFDLSKLLNSEWVSSTITFKNKLSSFERLLQNFPQTGDETIREKIKDLRENIAKQRQLFDDWIVACNKNLELRDALVALYGTPGERVEKMTKEQKEFLSAAGYFPESYYSDQLNAIKKLEGFIQSKYKKPDSQIKLIRMSLKDKESQIQDELNYTKELDTLKTKSYNLWDLVRPSGAELKKGKFDLQKAFVIDNSGYFQIVSNFSGNLIVRPSSQKDQELASLLYNYKKSLEEVKKSELSPRLAARMEELEEMLAPYLAKYDMMDELQSELNLDLVFFYHNKPENIGYQFDEKDNKTFAQIAESLEILKFRHPKMPLIENKIKEFKFEILSRLVLERNEILMGMAEDFGASLNLENEALPKIDPKDLNEEQKSFLEKEGAYWEKCVRLLYPENEPEHMILAALAYERRKQKKA